MPRARDILSAARAATVWLLMVVSMFLGPVSVFAAGPDACGDACPCEEADDDCDDCDDEQPADEHEYEHGTPPDEQCPGDCPGCHSSPGVALTSFEGSLLASLPSSSTPGLVPSDAVAIGVCTGVFRPPRSR